jgi:hypothetical protein
VFQPKIKTSFQRWADQIVSSTDDTKPTKGLSQMGDEMDNCFNAIVEKELNHHNKIF